MKAITLFQPYATLMALREKRIETRSWATHHRGPLAIHAAKSIPKRYAELAKSSVHIQRALAVHGITDATLPRSKVLCIVDVVGCFRVEEMHKAEFVLGRKIESREIAFGDFSEGRFLWLTEFVELVYDPGPTNGAQGMWEWLRGPQSAQVRQERAERAYDRGETTL